MSKRDREKEAEDQVLSDWQDILRSPAGQRVFAQILFSGEFTSLLAGSVVSMEQSSASVFHAEGVRSVAIRLSHHIDAVSPGATARLFTFYSAQITEEDQQ